MVMIRLLALLSICAVLGTSFPAAAEDEATRARRWAKEGKRLLLEARYDEALVFIEKALAIEDHAVGRYFQARCLVSLGRRLPEAQRILEGLQGDPVLGRHAEGATQLLAELRGKLRAAPFAVSVEGGGTGRLFVDDREVGVVPYEGELGRGTHTVRVEGTGCERGVRTVEVEPPTPVTLAFHCTPAPARIELRCDEPGVQVSVDGALVGTTPLGEALVVEPGQRTLRLAKDGFARLERQVRVEAGQTLLLDLAPLAIEERASGDSTWAWVTLSSGLALIGTGAGFLGQYGVDLSNARPATATRTADSVPATYAIIGGVSGGVGLGLFVASFFLWPDDEPGDVGATALRFTVEPVAGGGTAGFVIPF